MSMVPETEMLVAIPAMEWRPRAALPFDLFVRLPLTSRVILFRREGSELEPEIALKANSRDHEFFVSRDHYDRYLDYAANEVLSVIGQRPPDPARLKDVAGRMIGDTFSRTDGQAAREVLDHMGDVVVRLIAESMKEGSTERQALFLRFAKLAGGGTDFQRHPLHVASITTMLAIGLGISDQKTLVEVALAALLHDVGLTQLPVSVISEAHQFHTLGTVSKALLKMHPQGSLDLLRNRGIHVSRLMESMILEHHEEFSGEGYPQNLVGETIHPFAQVLHVADDLDDLLGTAEPKASPERLVRALFDRYTRDRVIEPVLLSRLKALVF